MFPSVGPVLLLTGVADHGQIRDRHMTVLGGGFIHTVLFHLLFGVFLHPVRCGIRHYADNLDLCPTCSPSLTLSLWISQVPPSFAVKLYSLASSPF
jgi:hypothetical protein